MTGQRGDTHINTLAHSPVQLPSESKTAKNNCRLGRYRTLTTQPAFAAPELEESFNVVHHLHDTAVT